MASHISYMKTGYRSDRWKWVLNLKERESLLSNPDTIIDNLSKITILQIYGLYKPPKTLPCRCRKKCTSNPWCLASISKEDKSNASQLTEQLRDMSHPIGLQNTANTCWINSALQALFHLHQFRNCINSVDGFEGEESLTSLEYLLQAMFVEMELHKNKAIACSQDSVFEKLAVFLTKEIMQKDQDFEVLKCVSEFLENTIDSLLGNPKTGPLFSPLFRTVLCRIAKWKCSSCKKEHVKQLPPDTCYTMAAYVSADECPLGQCILDLQTETQTGVSLLCGGPEGCGATVNVDRVVTPQIVDLPSLLIIRNNSLIDKEIKRRLHVVFPETLDLTSYIYGSDPALYSLRAVIFHHGHWIQHFSAHVKTEEGKWYNFNDEKVQELVSRSGNCIPLETHKNYFSVANVANKYKTRSRLRVSRGAFIWIYEKDVGHKQEGLIQPSATLLDYVLANQKNKLVEDAEVIQKMKIAREKLLEKLAVVNVKEEFSLISGPLLASWYSSQDTKFVPQPSLLAEGMCEHKKFDPLKSSNIKCIRKALVANLTNSECGIHSVGKIPIVYSPETGFCNQCICRQAHLILFKERLKELHKKAKKEAFKEPQIDTTFIGATTLANWTKLALNSYAKDHCLEVDEQSSDDAPLDVNKEGENTSLEEPRVNSNSVTTKSNGDCDKVSHLSEIESKPNGDENFSSFNEDIVCLHNMIDPKVSGVWLPNKTAEELKRLCGEVYPATYQEDFGICNYCKSDMDRILKTCSSGKDERKQLYHLFVERKRPNASRDVGKPLYLLSRDFLSDWKAYVRLCVKEDQNISRPTAILNACLMCKHNQVLYPCSSDGPLFDFAVLIMQEEWNLLIGFYPFDYSIAVHFEEDGKLVPEIGVCQNGCVEEEALKLYEDQFNFEYELIHIRQVNSVEDVPCSVDDTEAAVLDNVIPKKKPRLAASKANSGLSSTRTATQRLVRASKTFCSSSTIKEIQNFIAERTSIWPLLQTLWLGGRKEPLLLTDKHRSMTLNALRIKPNDTIYFRAAIEDLERAAGDGETEYNEILSEDDIV